MNYSSFISVIVPVYNVEPYLDRCVQSIVDQTYTNLEIILVDDGSPDNCPAMCDAWAEKDSRIKVIHKENDGVSDARNAGIQLSSGEYIVFIDSDDSASPLMITEMISNKNNGTVVVGYSNDVQLLVNEKTTIPLYHPKDLVAARGGAFCWGILYSASIIQTLDLQFDNDLDNLEDVVWNAIYFRYVDDIIFLDAPLYFHFNNPNSITSQCVDRKWQCRSWVLAYSSILKSAEPLSFSKSQIYGIRKELRRCINNIHAELRLTGERQFKYYYTLLQALPQKRRKNEPFLMWFSYHFTPWGEFIIYHIALNFKEKIQ